MSKKAYFDWKNTYKSHKYVDYSAVAMFEGTSLAISGLDTMELTTVLLVTTLGWSGLAITSTVTGKTITVSGSGMSVSDGDVLYLKNVEHPIRNNVTMSLQASNPGSSAVKKFGNLFIGAIVGGSLVLRSAGSGGYVTPAPVTTVEQVFIPITLAEDGSVPPAIEEVITSGNGAIRVRKFGGVGGTIVHDVVFPWEVPTDLVAASGIKFTVVGVLTETTGINTENVSFKLSGYSKGNGESIGGAFGSEVEVNLPSVSYAQYDRFKSYQSTTITVLTLAAGDTAFLHFERDTADASDNYLQPIGVSGIIIEWTRQGS